MEKLTPSATELKYSHMFMPRNLNHAGTIFGGDLIEWMEGCARHCTVRVFRQKSSLEDAIGSHACSLEALACV
jgi:acyl-CoA hydrolase